MYQDLYNQAKAIIKKKTCMEFYDVTKPALPRDRYIWYRDLVEAYQK